MTSQRACRIKSATTSAEASLLSSVRDTHRTKQPLAIGSDLDRGTRPTGAQPDKSISKKDERAQD